MALASKPEIGGPQISVRPMRPADIAAVSNILRQSPEAAPWSEESLVEMGLRGASWIAEVGGRTAAFLIGRMSADEFEILNLAVNPELRRRGIALELLTVALQWSKGAGAQRAFLDVRSSNQGAAALYRKLGFEECGRRRSYYRSPEEDAVVLSLPLKGSHSNPASR